MMVLILEKVPASLRGELSRWMIEPKTGVFVGRLSAVVRDMLWAKACKSVRSGGATLLYSSPSEQGFAVRSHGDTSRYLIDVEGIMLVRIPPRKGKEGETEDEGATEPLDLTGE